MSTEILVALTALAGTILGACITGINTLIKTRWMQKIRKKERHEKIVRIILVELLPDIKFVIGYSGTYETAISSEWKEKNMHWFNTAMLVYENKVKNDVPLNMIEMMADLNLCIDHLKYMVETKDSRLSEKYRELVHRTQEKIKEIEKKINTEYK